MKKAATILLWISMGLGLLYIIATVIGAVIGAATTPVPSANATIYIIGILYHIMRTTLPLVGKLLFVIIILFTMKAKSENIVAEIIAIIMFAGGGTLLNTIISTVMNFIIGLMGTDALASYGYMGIGATWASIFFSISNTLFFVGVAFAIAYKKVELPDLRRIMEEE